MASGNAVATDSRARRWAVVTKVVTVLSRDTGRLDWIQAPKNPHPVKIFLPLRGQFSAVSEPDLNIYFLSITA